MEPYTEDFDSCLSLIRKEFILERIFKNKLIDQINDIIKRAKNGDNKLINDLVGWDYYLNEEDSIIATKILNDRLNDI